MLFYDRYKFAYNNTNSELNCGMLAAQTYFRLPTLKGPCRPKGRK